MNPPSEHPPSSWGWSRMSVAAAILLLLLDGVRLVVLPPSAQEAFMDGFEAFVVLLCALACGFAAARSSRVGRELWVLVAIFFVLMAAADLHDFLVDISLSQGALASLFEFLGWCAYFPLALLIFFPIEKDGRPDWTWLPFLDFLLVASATAMAYFQLIYLPHSLSGQHWTIVGQPELVRNVLLSLGLLVRAGVDPSSQGRAFYRRVGGLFASITFLRIVFPGYLDIVFSLVRPALWLVLGVLAFHWKEMVGERPDENGRRGALRLFLSLCAAATLLVVVVLALSAPAPYLELMYLCVGVSVVLFILRTYHAERSRYNAETQLRNSERDYRVLFESAIVPIVIFEPGSERILQANAAACELYGVAPGDLVGASMRDFTKDVARGEEQIGELLRVGTCQRFESVHRTRDGREIDVLVSSSVIHYGGKKVILSFNRDITERKRAEERFYTAFSANPEPVTISAQSDGTYIDVNQAFLRTTGYAREEVIGRTALDSKFWPTSNARARFLKELERGPVRDFEVTFGTKSGELRSGLLSGEIIEIGGQRCLLAITNDVTDRKRAEQALRESEDRYRDLVEHSHDLICTHDLNGRLLSVNQEPARILGYTPEELLAMSMKELVCPEFRPQFDDYLQKIRREGHAQGLLAVRTRSGEKRIWEFHNTLRTEGVPEPVVRGMAHDVTDRKRAEKALRESEERFRSLVENATVGIYRTTPDGRILMANPALVKMLGYDSFEALAARDLEATGFERDYPRAEFRMRLERDGEVRGLESAWRRNDGTTLFVRETARAIRDSFGHVLFYDGIVEDITERKLADQALIRLRHAVDASGEVVFMTDRDGVITSINPEFTRLYGYTAEEVVGKTTPRILKSGDKSREDYADFWNTILDKKIARGDIVNKTRDGRLVTVESSANPILDDRGEITGFLAIQRDITARKQLEEQFRQAQKMEAIGRLAGGVAHDFNNLLTIINGYGQLLQERFAEEEPVRAPLAEILKAGDRATALTRQLLAFSRRQVLEPKDLDLGSIVEGMQTMLRRLIGEDVELNISVRKSLGLVKADPTQVEQLILNLVVNARDAMPHGGKLTIETATAELDQTYAQSHSDVTPGHYVMLGVSDTGVGMNNETIAHIFEPFFTTKERGKGTGLGLSTVYGIVKQTRGHISVYSEPGRGTTFKVFLPQVAKFSETAAITLGSARPLGGSETILLVEDEKAVRGLAVSVLKEYGYHVLESETPQEAVEIGENRQTPIDLLLTDVVMPGMSGRNIAEHLAFLRPEMKVLYMSGYTDDAIIHHGVLQSGVAFMQKPFTPEVLARKVREVLDMSQA